MEQQRRRSNLSMTDAYAKYIESIKIAEKTVIGALLLESDAISRVASILKPEHFYNVALGTIYGAIYGLWTDGEKPEVVKVAERLLKAGKMDSVGGMVGLGSLMSAVASTTNLEDHAMYVRQCYTQRSLKEAGGKITEMAMDVSMDVGDQVSGSLRLVEQIALDMDYDNPMTEIAQATDEALEEYREKEALRSEGRRFGIMSGLQVLDKYTNGFKPGDLVVVGARPGMGKTSLLLHFAKNMAEQGKKIVIFSLEMCRTSLVNRLILSYADFNPYAFRGGYLTQFEKPALAEAAEKVRALPIAIDETPNIAVQQIKIRCINRKRKQGLDCVMIDYLQLMNIRADNRHYNREQEIAQTTRRLKQLAKELQVPVVLLSQLNRNVEAKLAGGKKTTTLPGLADLRESGAIEQDADVVLLIHRPEYYEDSDAVKGV